MTGPANGDTAVREAVLLYRDLVERAAVQMEAECKRPPCQHAAGMRLALSYLDDVRVFTTAVGGEVSAQPSGSSVQGDSK